MGKHWINGLCERNSIWIGYCILTNCIDQSFIVNIDSVSNDLIDHYAVCAQSGDRKYDLFRISNGTSRFLAHTPSRVSADSNFRASIRAFGSKNQVLGAGSASVQVENGSQSNPITIDVKYFSESYQICYEPGFCANPGYVPGATDWYGTWLADNGNEGWAVGADIETSAETGERKALRPKISKYLDGKWSLIPDEMIPRDVSGQPISLNAVWGSDSSNVWAVGGNGTILYWDGNRWNDISKSVLCKTTSNLFGVWGPKQTKFSTQKSNGCRIWVVGDNGTVICGDGNSWDGCKKTVILSNRIPVLRKVWGTSESDVWLVGGYIYNSVTPYKAYELILKWENGGWKEHRLGIEHYGYLTGVSGSNSNDIWAVGDTTTILNWNGSEWVSKTPQVSGFQIDFDEQDQNNRFINGFNSVWVGSGNDVYMPMYSGRILHWNRRSSNLENWTVSNDQSRPAFLALSGTDSCNMLVAGGAGYLGVYLPDAPSDAY